MSVEWINTKEKKLKNVEREDIVRQKNMFTKQLWTFSAKESIFAVDILSCSRKKHTHVISI